MGVFQNNLMGAAAAAGGAAAAGFYTHQIANSCRFDGTAHMSDTRGSDGSTTTGTISFWFKRSKLGSYQYLMESFEDGNNYCRLTIKADDTIEFQNETGAAMKFELETTQVFRDTSAWYHFVGIIDMTNGTQGNRVQIWINGVRVTAFETETYPADASQTMVLNTSATLRLGNNSEANYDFDGYLAEFVVIDGTAQAATDFGTSTNGVWIPDDPSGLTFGTNGVYLKYESSGDMGNDSSGNNNDFSVTNIAASDQMLDSPTFGDDGSANFCTFTPLTGGTSNITFSEGNLKASTTANIEGMICSFGIPIGSKFYWEMTQTGWSGSDGDDVNVGVNTLTQPDFQNNRGGNDTAYAYTCNVGAKVVLGSYSSYGDSFRTGDVIGIAIDRVNHTFQGYKNGVGQGTFSIASTGDLYPWIGVGGGFSESITLMNFGADSSFSGQSGLSGTSAEAADENGYGDFYDTPPSGFLALCAGNLPIAEEIDPAETDDNYPSKLYVAMSYLGNGASSRSVTGVGFQPDLVFIKAGSDGDKNWTAYDSTRGATKYLVPNANTAETTDATTLTAFGADGFTVGNSALTNEDARDWQALAWRANGGSLTTNDVGTQTSYTQTDPSGGFSITKYAGTGSAMTVGHGLSVEPKITIIKDRDAAVDWVVYTKLIDGSLDYLLLNTTAAKGDSGFIGPNSSIWNFNAESGYSNTSGRNYIMYNFANIEGMQKFSKYTGNGNADGVFIETDFLPRCVWIKNVDATEEWCVYAVNDYSPNAYIQPYYNPVDMRLNFTTANRQVDADIDFLANGFKVRNTNAQINSSSTDYVYMAWGNVPFKYDNTL